MKIKIGQRVVITHPTFLGITGTITDFNEFTGDLLVKIDEKYHKSLKSRGWKLNLYMEPKYLILQSTMKRVEVE